MEQTHIFREILNIVQFPIAVYTLENLLYYCNDAFQHSYSLNGQAAGCTFSKAGNEAYYKISRLNEAIQYYRDGKNALQSDIFAGYNRIYAPLKQADTPMMLEMLIPLYGMPQTAVSTDSSLSNGMILSDINMQSTMETIHRIANFDSTVLITGETGTGKTSLAKYIHTTGKRAEMPFITLDCASIPETIIESELFGYVSGRYPDAAQKGKLGLVEAANGGTLFLDEISMLPLSLQSKLLQLMQDKTYFPVGSTERKNADVRVISATNTDLKKQVEDGLFREDLYYRLRVIEFHIPPLRERTDAIEPLIEQFVNHFNQKYHISKTILPRAKEILKRHSWNGNISELQYVIERAMITSICSEIDSGDIPPLQDIVPADEAAQPELRSFEQSVEDYERKLLRRAYQQYGSSYKVADALGISQTKASRLLRKYRIS